MKYRIVITAWKVAGDINFGQSFILIVLLMTTLSQGFYFYNYQLL